MSTQNPETSDSSKPKKRPESRRLRPDDFVTYDELIELLPEPMTKDAIRKLRMEHGLQAHRIGLHTMFLGSEVIAASARPPSTPKDISEEE